MSRYYDDELYHFGVKGMRWGVRRYQNADGSYTNAGKQRRSKSSADESTEKKGLSDRQKRALKIGAATVAAGLAVYGGYKVGRHIKITKEVKDVVNKAAEQEIKDRAARTIRNETNLWTKLGSPGMVDKEKITKEVTDKVRAGAPLQTKDLVYETKTARSKQFKEKVRRATDRYARAFPPLPYEDPIATYKRHNKEFGSNLYSYVSRRPSKKRKKSK